MLVCGERETTVMAPPLPCDSAVSRYWIDRGSDRGSIMEAIQLPRLPGFPPQAFPTTISSLTSPRSISPQSTAALTLGLLHNPGTPAPSHGPFQGTCVPVLGVYGCGMDCLILIPFTLPQISCFTLSIKCFLPWFRPLPGCGNWTSALLPPPVEGRSSLLTLLLFPLVPSSYQVLRGSIEGSGTPLQYSCLENPMDRGAW